MRKHNYYITWKCSDALKHTEIVGDLPITIKRKIKTHEDIKYIKAFILEKIKKENKIMVSNLVITNIIKL